MKKILAVIFTLLVGAIAVKADLVITTGVTESDFLDAFSERVWYAQIQPGGAGTTDPDNEFEIGGLGLVYYEGNASIVDKTDNPFSIIVDSANNLSLTLNGVSTPDGSEYPITDAYNMVWVGVKLATGNGFNNILDVNHSVDGAPLPAMHLEEQSDNWISFKFYLDDSMDNIGEISITGNINPDMFLGVAENEEWTYTVVATNDPSLVVPEPTSSIMILLGFAGIMLFSRKIR